MKSIKIVWILLLGLVLIGSAGWYRHQALRLPRRPALLPAPVARLDSRTLDAQAAPLLKAVAAAPRALEPRWNLVAFYGRTGQGDKAAEQVEAIDRLHPQDIGNQLALANTRMLLKQYARAEQEYRQALAHNPRLLAARQGLAAALFQQRRYFEAIGTAQQAVRLAPDNAGSHLILASSALQYALQFPNSALRSDEFSLARSEYRRLLQTLPNNADVHYHLGQADANLNRDDDAAKDFQKALQLAPREDIYRDAAKAYVQMGRRARAQEVAEEGLTRYPNDALLHDVRGQLFQTSAASDADAQALAEFQKAVQLEPGNGSFRSDLGTALLRSGNLPAAQAAFETAARLNPTRTFNYQQLAAIYTRQGNTQNASLMAKAAKDMFFNNDQLKQVESLTIAHPDSVPLHLILADRFRDLTMPDAARDEYLLVRRLDPKNARAKQGLAAPAAKSPISPLPASPHPPG